MKKRNMIAKDLYTPKYASRIVGSKKKEYEPEIDYADLEDRESFDQDISDELGDI